jgi:nucleotide-binding universal stress UspA family protein
VHCYFDAAAAVAAVDELPQGNEGPDAQADLRLLLSESVAGLSEKYPDVEVSLRLAHGLVDEGLPTLADQAALTVVGHHHGHPMRRWWAGAMATAILERSHGTVVVVPEAEDTEGT